MLGAIVIATLLCSIAHISTAATLIRYARDVESMTRFYAEFPETELLSEAESGSRIRLGGTHLWILPLFDKPDSTSGSPDLRSAPSQPDQTILLISVADLERASELLRARQIESQPFVENGMSLLRFEDPEGYAVGFVSASSNYAADGSDPAASSSDAPTTSPAKDGSNLRSFRSGHTEMIFTGGLYGIWMSTAFPLAFDVDDPQAYGASILVGGSAAVYLAHRFARRHNITSGQAGFITVMAHFATSQALGWAAVADMDGEDVALAGAFASLGALTTGALIAPSIDISRGQAEVLGSALAWGAWYGLSYALMADANETGPPALVGSAAALGLAGWWTAGHDVGAGRARLVNLGGLVGTAAGFGLDLMFEIDDDQQIFALPTLAGLGGMVLASHLTRNRSSHERADADSSSDANSYLGQLSMTGDGQVRVALWGRDFH